MASSPFGTVLHYLDRLRGEGGAAGEEDARLLARYARQGDEGAFAALVRRHGPMVWAACVRMLPREQDAEDAFQATFLVLARKAGSLRHPDRLGPWLHGVACRTAAKARALMARRQACELVVEPPAPAAPVPDVDWRELRGVLDEEVNRLPERYRLPFALCYLEGLTNEQAAARLGCPKGTVLSRLARARARLRGRLARRGLAVPVTLLGVALAGQPARALPPALVEATARLGLLSAAPAAQVLTLAQGALHAMLCAKLKLAAVALLALGLAGSAAGLLAQRGPAPAAPAPAPPAPAEPGRPTAPAVDKKEKPAPARPPKKDKEPAPVALAVPDVDLREALQKTVVWAGVEQDKGLTLKEVLDGLFAKRHDLTFEVNERAFKAEGVNDVEAVQIVETAGIGGGRMAVATMLRKVLDRVPSESGATFLVRKDTIEITTAAAVRAELGVPKDRPLLPLVWEKFEKRPLRGALDRLADASGYSVVLDARVAGKAKDLEVTARLANVPVDTAVGLLADMAGLDVARLDNVFYVTTPENAARLRAKASGAPPPGRAK
jgi:RNA polymerase sigma factor (sigma-70 family)